MNDTPAPATYRGFPPAWAWVVASGAIAHFLVPLTDYIIWDGWWYATDLGRVEGPAIMARLFHEVGRPLDMAFYGPLRLAGGDATIWAKWLSTVTWIAAAVCTGAVLRRLGGLSPTVASAVAALAAAAPVFDMLGELALWMNTACVLLFWVAWLFVSLLPTLRGWGALGVRLAALALFFVSFDLNSNLVMFYAVAATLVSLRLRDLRPSTLRQRLPSLTIHYADFLALPVVFWLWKTWFTPANGFYASGYNQPSLAPDRLAIGYFGLFIDFVLRGLVDLVSSPLCLAVASLAGIVTAIAIVRLRVPHTDVDGYRRLGLWLALSGVFLLAAAAFPYIAVGQALAHEGWLTRNCILCPLPVALIACGAALELNRWLPARPHAWLITVAMLVVLSAGGCIRNYLAWQAFGAKQWSIREKLNQAIDKTGACAIQLRDYAYVPGTIPYYPPIIWTYIGSTPPELPKTFVIETTTAAADVFQRGPGGDIERTVPQIPLTPHILDQLITATTMPYALERVSRTGPQLLVMVEPGFNAESPTALGLRYLLLRWLDGNRLPEFVREFTKVQSFPMPKLE